jgi:hypothetical protein
MRIGIIGTGWYGNYIATELCDNHDVTLIDKQDDIFSGSSSKNQNRLHLGFHYPRSSKTRNRCKKFYEEFVDKYYEIIEDIPENWYIIPKESLIDFNSFTAIFYHEKYNFELLDNKYFNGIDGKIIKVNEKYINPVKAKTYFKSVLKGKVNYLFNTNIDNMVQHNNEVILNNEYHFDVVFNCTYNQISDNENDCNYEKCVQLIYKKVGYVPFDCVTMMDGRFNSLFSYGENKYTLTDVEFTPVFQSSDINTLYEKEISKKMLSEIIEKMETKISIYYPDFNKYFVYENKLISYKCKNINNNADRSINIVINNRIMNVWCGKISLVFELKDNVAEFIDRI